MRLFIKIATIIVLCCNISCRNIEVPDDVAEYSTEFQASISEVLHPENRAVELVFKSIAKYCDSTAILFQQTTLSEAFNIELKEIEAVEDCNAPNISAQANILLGTLAPGTYDISIELRDALKSVGRLTVNDETYQIQLFKSEGISLVNEVIVKVPPGLIWGEIWFNDSTAAIANGFLDFLDDRSSSTELIKGNYSFFSFDNGGLSIATQPLPFKNRLLFFKKATAAQVADLLLAAQQTANALGTNGVVKLNTWRGEVF